MAKWPEWAKCICCWSDELDPLEHYAAKEFILLPCFHVICATGDCFGKTFKEDEGPSSDSTRGPSHVCPSCARTILISPDIKSRTINPLDFMEPDPPEPKLCTSCIRKRPAKTWCFDCERYLCDLCTEYHGYAVSTTSHLLLLDIHLVDKKKEEEFPEAPEPKCKSHPAIKAMGYCTNCDVPLCSGCKNFHGTCQISLMQDMPQFMKKNVEQLNKQMSNMVSELEKVQAHIPEKVQSLLTTEKAHLEKEVQSMLTALISNLYSRGNKVRREIHKISEESARLVHLKKEEYDRRNTSVTQYQEMVRSLLARVAEREDAVMDEDFLPTFRLLKQSLPEQIKSMRKFTGSFFELENPLLGVDETAFQTLQCEIPNFCDVHYEPPPPKICEKGNQTRNRARTAQAAHSGDPLGMRREGLEETIPGGLNHLSSS